MVSQRSESRLRHEMLSRSQHAARKTSQQEAEGALLGLAIGKHNCYHVEDLSINCRHILHSTTPFPLAALPHQESYYCRIVASRKNLPFPSP